LLFKANRSVLFSCSARILRCVYCVASCDAATSSIFSAVLRFGLYGLVQISAADEKAGVNKRDLSHRLDEDVMLFIMNRILVSNCDLS